MMQEFIDEIFLRIMPPVPGRTGSTTKSSSLWKNPGLCQTVVCTFDPRIVFVAAVCGKGDDGVRESHITPFPHLLAELLA